MDWLRTLCVCLPVWPGEGICEEKLNIVVVFIYDNADAKRILLASLPAYWRRQLGRPRITWLSTIQQDLKQHHLTLPEAADLAQNRPLWRTMSTYGATQSWVACQKRRRRSSTIEHNFASGDNTSKVTNVGLCTLYHMEWYPRNLPSFMPKVTGTADRNWPENMLQESPLWEKCHFAMCPCLLCTRTIFRDDSWGCTAIGCRPDATDALHDF